MGDEPLIEAIRQGNVDAAKALIASGASVDLHGAEQEWTPLCHAAGRGDLAMVKLLVEAGADVGSTGRDQRTPYDIAVAAGRVAVARYLAEATARAGRTREPRPYCRAYPLQALRAFPEWPKDGLPDGHAAVFLHQDLTVTRSMFHGESVILAEVSPGWRSFCREVLGFEAPDDLDLIAESNDES